MECRTCTFVSPAGAMACTMCDGTDIVPAAGPKEVRRAHLAPRGVKRRLAPLTSAPALGSRPAHPTLLPHTLTTPAHAQ